MAYLRLAILAFVLSWALDTVQMDLRVPIRVFQYLEETERELGYLGSRARYPGTAAAGTREPHAEDQKAEKTQQSLAGRMMY